ncbi:hypothetical protein [Microbacterium phyllosphaerae]|uniref:hypothetical protein n=1 Tax=Microbacterium phyllosphaerae TaxID=124798 RepID=UPI002169B41F|nr:hypothetical protein [Microbacterium phyllosphaerae]MCS3442202.1 hypothetical protein [Microbacterium phyllosphaerae]
MTTFTNSRSSAIMVSILGDLTLEDLRAELTRRKPDHAQLEGGWASIDDTASNIGRRNVAPPESDPEILPAAGEYPRRLAARYYFFTSNKRLKRDFPDSEQEHHVVDAFDVLIHIDSEDRMVALLSSRTATAAGRLMKALREAVAELDESGRVEVDGGELGFTPDLFFWLIVRSRDNRQIDGRTAIDAVLAVNGQDNVRRTTLLSDGVDFSRPALLVAVAEIEQLGPVRVALADTQLNAKVTADVWSGGVFSVRKGDTHYTDEVDSPELRFESIQDFAYHLLPKLIRAYYADAEDDWNDARRSAEIEAAAQSIIDRYRTKYPQLGLAPA